MDEVRKTPRLITAVDELHNAVTVLEDSVTRAWEQLDHLVPHLPTKDDGSTASLLERAPASGTVGRVNDLADRVRATAARVHGLLNLIEA